MSLGNTQLIGSIYSDNVVKIEHFITAYGITVLSPLAQLRVPLICPNCLKPGNTTEYVPAGSISQIIGIMKYTQNIRIPFSTHIECSQGGSRRNISSSVRVWVESDKRVGFEFREPFYSTLFISANFPILRDRHNIRLVDRVQSYLHHLENQKKASYKRKSLVCPRCKYEILVEELEEFPKTCPSCEFNFDQPEALPLIRADSEFLTLKVEEDQFITCPQCGIAMTMAPGLTACGRCGYKLGEMR